MSVARRGLLLALVQALIVSSLGGVLLLDRARLPRAWVRAAPVDPNLPIRGRYVRLRLECEGRGLDSEPYPRDVAVEVEDGRLVARRSGPGEEGVWATVSEDGTVTLTEPLAYFIPEHVADPSIRPLGEELWVEVTVPRKGPPRPIRLGVLETGAGGEPRPLEIR